MNLIIVCNEDQKQFEIFSDKEKATRFINSMKNVHYEHWYIFNAHAQLDPSVPL